MSALYSCTGVALKALENVCPPIPVGNVGVLGENEDENVDAPRGAALGGAEAGEGVIALGGSDEDG